VYDTATGRFLIIPQGTKLLGIYASDVHYGQDTLLVAWQRLTFPDGKTLDLGSMPGTDSAGFGGFRDKVDNHYMRIFGSALLMSGIVGGITYSQNLNQANQGPSAAPTAGSVLSQALGQQLGEVTAQMISKNLNIAPSIKIGSGYRFNILVVKDLVFQKPYRVFDY
jgi:type IV secretion system protein TrbI